MLRQEDHCKLKFNLGYIARTYINNEVIHSQKQPKPKSKDTVGDMSTCSEFLLRQLLWPLAIDPETVVTDTVRSCLPLHGTSWHSASTPTHPISLHIPGKAWYVHTLTTWWTMAWHVHILMTRWTRARFIVFLETEERPRFPSLWPLGVCSLWASSFIHKMEELGKPVTPPNYCQLMTFQDSRPLQRVQTQRQSLDKQTACLRWPKVPAPHWGPR